MPNVLDLRNEEVSEELEEVNAQDITKEEGLELPPPSSGTSLVDMTGFEWEAPEYNSYNKPTDWYWALGIFTIGLLAVAVIMKNVLFGVFVLLAGFTMGLFGAKPPRVRTFSVSHEGLSIDSETFPFSSLSSFWIFYNPPHQQEVSIETQRSMQRYIKIPLGELNPLEIRKYLLQYIPEKPHEESLIDILSHYLRF